jgi:hypothetical protein
VPQSALTAAVRDELVSRNVAALIKVPVPRAHRALVWTVEEARTFLESARAASDPFYAAYVLMPFSGSGEEKYSALLGQKLILKPARP